MQEKNGENASLTPTPGLDSMELPLEKAEWRETRVRPRSREIIAK
jgi:hypothetical protein